MPMKHFNRFLTHKTLKIILGIVIIIIVAAIFGSLFTESATDVVRLELKTIQANNLDKAYALTTDAFQLHTSLDQFKGFIEKYPALKGYKTIHVDEKRV